MTSEEERCRQFRALHESGCFLIPNPWDVGSTKYLERLGFQALATTSAGYAFSRGLPDGAVPRDQMLAHIGDIVNATNLPVNADFGSGFADDPERLAQNVKLCAAKGVAGLSIEDATGDTRARLYELDMGIERIRAAKAALVETTPDVLLVARTECFLVGHPDPLKESARRIEAYAEAGADVLFAPGIRTRDEIQAIVAAAGAKPVNVLAGSVMGLRVTELAELGVRRISLGGALARAAWAGFIRAATSIIREGSFDALDSIAPFSQLNQFFASLM